MQLTNEQFMAKMEELISTVVDVPTSSKEMKTMFIQRFIHTCVEDTVTYLSQKENEEHE